MAGTIKLLDEPNQVVITFAREDGQSLTNGNNSLSETLIINGLAEERIIIDGQQSDIKVKMDELPSQENPLPLPSEIVDSLDQNGHLPGMPSQDVLSDGFYLKNFSIKLMQEVENLARIVAEQDLAIAALNAAEG